MKNIKKEHCLATTHPELVKEWHPTKNGTLTPTNVSAGSHKKVWWVCKEGHAWEAIISNRASGSGCPYCSGRSTCKGINDLATTHPELVKEWHPTKNGAITPADVPAGSAKKVWWICKQGHEWETTIHNRTKGSGCPYCARKLCVTGLNDLATTHPELVKEWHPTKNSNLTPADVSAGSDKKVWWVCKEGHEWKATIRSRTKGAGCPYCSGRLCIAGLNDLATTHPELVKEWHPTKNGNLTPHNVMCGSRRKVWWIDEKGREKEIKVQNKVRAYTRRCSNHEIV